MFFSKIGPNCNKLSPCQNGGKCVDTCNAAGFQCTCANEFTGTYCENEKGEPVEEKGCVINATIGSASFD